MGMGEPLLNLKAVVRAVYLINAQLGIGGRNITISTVGVHNAMMQLAEYNLQVRAPSICAYHPLSCARDCVRA